VTRLVVFEDAAHGAFEILAALRGVFDLRCGGRTLLERLQTVSGANSLTLLGRPWLHDLFRDTHAGADVGSLRSAGAAADEVLFLNGRLLLFGADLPRLVAGPAGGVAVVDASSLLAARVPATVAGALATGLQARVDETEPAAQWLAREVPALPLVELAAEPGRCRDGSRLVAHAWDLVHYNGPAIIDDFRAGPGAGVEPGALLYPGVHLLQDGAIRIAAGCRIKPGVVLDAEDGPITFEAGVEVQPNVVVRGPAHIGPRCVLKCGAKVHEGTSVGPVCKIGGEVEETIVQGFSNKQHEGFLGHAYLGEWVNLGADTNNSDLKNNYSSVRVWEGGRGVDTGLLFVGLLAGDHVKSAINTQFNTGTVVGLSSQIFGSGFPPKFIAPFGWGGAESLELYDLERAFSTAQAVMARRKLMPTTAYETAFRSVFATWRDRPRSAKLG
jgi:UDP-N-acetylglucosamine diphosphorylase / glucose-1-phosphate thymidylyltransferase / UDP-N-acetylgalactosamine diphosphorylase / glucosamine-1-phosphate N-acetyltransferase / galactosamine-1-phosphate N-acetyltransferase